MFITEAFAQDAAGGTSAMGSSLEMLLLFAPLMVVWYFLLIRPQRNQMKKRNETLANIRRGDQVVLGSGVVGKVTKVVDEKTSFILPLGQTQVIGCGVFKPKGCFHLEQ